MDHYIALLFGSTIALTALVTMIMRSRFKGNIKIAVAPILGIFAGIGGASHGPGEILKDNIAPDEIIMEAWPTLMKSLGGEPAMSVILNLLVTGGWGIISSLVVTIWATQIQRRNGSLILIMLSIVMVLVGRGLLPPVFGVIAGVIGTRSSKEMISTTTTTTVHAGCKTIRLGETRVD